MPDKSEKSNKLKARLPRGLEDRTPGEIAATREMIEKIRAVYDAYVQAKKKCNEDVSKLSLESVANSLRKQVPELLKTHKAKSVDFKVVIKDGKAVLRAVPKGE